MSARRQEAQTDPRPASVVGDVRAGELSNATVGLTLPPSLLDVLAIRVADLLVERGLLVVAGAASGPEPWIGVEDAARHLACPRSRIYSLVSARRIPHCKDGSRVLFRRSELDLWVEAGGGKRP